MLIWVLRKLLKVPRKGVQRGRMTLNHIPCKWKKALQFAGGNPKIEVDNCCPCLPRSSRPSPAGRFPNISFGKPPLLHLIWLSLPVTLYVTQNKIILNYKINIRNPPKSSVFHEYFKITMLYLFLLFLFFFTSKIF